MLHPVLHDHGRALHIHRYRYAGLQRDREARSFSLREKKGKGKMTAAAAAGGGVGGEGREQANAQQAKLPVYIPRKNLPADEAAVSRLQRRGFCPRSDRAQSRAAAAAAGEGGGEEGERRQKRGHPASRERACGAIVTARALSSRPLETFPVVRGPFVNPDPPPPAAAASSHLAAPPAPVLERRFAE